ncbi:AlbA family DNA-binding domain-containing protein [Burkholderia pseudomallei]|uniref:AlbA family DNA-binding domain-containing protein n=2 Tax=Burkholderiaceae TaxID=119060 RepID=UPI00050FEF78|nr:putative DNA binding domain-containing protein [Burkholderia pseudomallei]KGC45144.1 divergent AAA domain protein [Burkholderia pseudomallei]
MLDNNRLIQALGRRGEAADVDFKSALDVSATGEWHELIKDIAAFANSGGGYILA